MMGAIILFDGVCNFCDSSVQFIIKHDRQGYFKFTSLESETGKELLLRYRIPESVDSIVLIDGDTYYLKSTAALQIARRLNGGWKLLTGLTIIPSPIRDFFYEIVAKNRYKWFGKKDHCMVPSPEIRERFL